jgi:WD40 repeat protein
MGAVGATFALRTWGQEALPPSPTTAIHFTAGDRIWLAMESRLVLAAWPDLHPLQTLELPTDKILALGSSGGANAGSSLFAAGGIPGEVGHLLSISTADAKLQWQQEVGSDVLRCMDVDRTTGRIAAGGHHQKIHVWDPEVKPSASAIELNEHTAAVTGLLFLNPDQLVSSSHDQTLRVWEVQQRRVLRSLQQHADDVEGLIRLPDSESGLPQCLSFARDKTARIWQPSIGRQVRLARLPTVGLSGVLDTDPRVVWIGGDQGEAYAIDLQTVQVLERRKLSEAPILSMARYPGQAKWLAGSGRGITSVQKPASRA